MCSYTLMTARHQKAHKRCIMITVFIPVKTPGSDRHRFGGPPARHRFGPPVYGARRVPRERASSPQDSKGMTPLMFAAGIGQVAERRDEAAGVSETPVCRVKKPVV